MVKTWTDRELIDLGLGTIDWIAGHEDRALQMPNVEEVKVKINGIQLAALRKLAKAAREKGV